MVGGRARVAKWGGLRLAWTNDQRKPTGSVPTQVRILSSAVFLSVIELEHEANGTGGIF